MVYLGTDLALLDFPLLKWSFPDGCNSGVIDHLFKWSFQDPCACATSTFWLFSSYCLLSLLQHMAVCRQGDTPIPIKVTFIPPSRVSKLWALLYLSTAMYLLLTTHLLTWTRKKVPLKYQPLGLKRRAPKVFFFLMFCWYKFGIRKLVIVPISRRVLLMKKTTMNFLHRVFWLPGRFFEV